MAEVSGRHGGGERWTGPRRGAAERAPQRGPGETLGAETHRLADAELLRGAWRQRRWRHVRLAHDDALGPLRVARGTSHAARMRGVERAGDGRSLVELELDEHGGARGRERRVLSKGSADQAPGLGPAELQRQAEVVGEGLLCSGAGHERADAREAAHVAGASWRAAGGGRRGGPEARRQRRRVGALAGERRGAIRRAAPESQREGREAAVDDAGIVCGYKGDLTDAGVPARGARHARARAAGERELVRATGHARAHGGAGVRGARGAGVCGARGARGARGGARGGRLRVRGAHARVRVRDEPGRARRARAVADLRLHVVRRAHEALLPCKVSPRRARACAAGGGREAACAHGAA